MARWTLSTGQVHNLQNSSRGTPADGNSHRCKSKAGRCTNNLLTLYWPSTFFYWLSIDSLMTLYWLPLTASDFYWPLSPSFDFYWLPMTLYWLWLTLSLSYLNFTDSLLTSTAFLRLSNDSLLTLHILTLYWLYTDSLLSCTDFYWLSIDFLMTLYWLLLTASDSYWLLMTSIDFFWLLLT